MSKATSLTNDATNHHKERRARQRKSPARRLFNGIVGRGCAPKSAPVQPTVTELVAKQQATEQMWDLIRGEGWQPGDDDPIVKTTRARSGGRTPVFQRYQFRLRSNGARSARWDRGMSPHVYDSMSAHPAVRRSGLDDENRSGMAETNKLYTAGKDSAPPCSTIGTVAQSMPKGFSVGVLSSKFDFTNPPRQPKPETAWVFSEPRLKFFVTRQISDEALEAYENDTTDLDDPLVISKFGRPLKTYIALYQHFLIGSSDDGFLEDAALSHQRLWTTVNALKRDRSRLIKEGFNLFGTAAEPKDAPEDYDPDRVNRIWAIFIKVFRALPYTPD